MRLTLLILVLTPLILRASDSLEERSRVLEAGNAAFDAGQYPESIGHYQKLLDSGVQSGEVYYNLGSAYFRNKALGQAIFNFRKASELLPRDPDVRFNIGYARNKVVDKIEEKGVQPPRLPLSLKEAIRFLALASLLFWGIAIVQLYRPRDWTLWARHGALAVLIVMATSAFQAWMGSPAFGVVTASEAEVFSGPGKDKTLLFKLHEGAEFQLSEGAGEWLRITLSDGKKGWIKRQDIVI